MTRSAKPPVDVTSVRASLKAAKKSLKPRSKTAASQLGAVTALLDDIEEMKAEGFAYDEIAATLKNVGLEIDAKTLRTYVGRLKKKRAEQAPAAEPAPPPQPTKAAPTPSPPPRAPAAPPASVPAAAPVAAPAPSPDSTFLPPASPAAGSAHRKMMRSRG